MPATAHVDVECRERFEDAIDALPQVRSGMLEAEWNCPRKWWHVPSLRQQNEPRSTGVYTIECVLGAALADNFLRVLREYPDVSRSFIESTLKDMVAVGRLSGVEVAFIERLVGNMALRGAPALSVVKPIVFQPTG